MVNNTNLRDALNNIGLPQLINEMSDKEPSIEHLKTIKNEITIFDNYYISGFQGSETRNTLKTFLNKWAIVYRKYSLIISH